VLARKTGNVDLDGDGTNGRPEVEEAAAVGLDSEPICQVARVGHGRRQPDDPQLVVGVRRNEVGPGDDSKNQSRS
jgi:hypothetical protein